MKDFKKPSAALISVLIICLAFGNGCKEQESDKLVTPQIADLKLNVDYPVTSKNKLLRLSPGLSFSIKESFTENAYKIPKGIVTLTEQPLQNIWNDIFNYTTL